MNNKMRKSWMRRWRRAHDEQFAPEARKYRVARAPITNKLVILKNDGRDVYQHMEKSIVVTTYSIPRRKKS